MGFFMSDQLLWSLGFTLIVAGITVVLIAVALFFRKGAKSSKEKVKGGGIIFIGPIPIIFGTDKETIKIILILFIVLMILMLFWISLYKIL